MEAIDPTAYLTLEELCAEVARLGRRQRLVAKGEEISGRTVRFYIEKELLPPPGRSGPGKKYAYETVWRVLFVRLLKARYELPLNQMRQTMRSVDVETMRRVVTGEEPLEVANGADVAAVRRHAAKGYQVVALTGAPDASAGSAMDDVLIENGERDMFATETREERRPPAGERVSDAPQRLRELTDVAKGQAIAAGMERAVGQAFTAEVEAVRYGALDRLREFQRPAEIRVTLTPVDGDDCGRVQKVAESELEEEIAGSLGKAAGEEYRVRIVDKNYAPSNAGSGSMRLTIQVGRA